MAMLAAEVGDVARAGREARSEALHQRETAVSSFVRFPFPFVVYFLKAAIDPFIHFQHSL
jgi:hypothetical protein